MSDDKSKMLFCMDEEDMKHKALQDVESKNMEAKPKKRNYYNLTADQKAEITEAQKAKIRVELKSESNLEDIFSYLNSLQFRSEQAIAVNVMQELGLLSPDQVKCISEDLFSWMRGGWIDRDEPENLYITRMVREGQKFVPIDQRVNEGQLKAEYSHKAQQIFGWSLVAGLLLGAVIGPFALIAPVLGYLFSKQKYMEWCLTSNIKP